MITVSGICMCKDCTDRTSDIYRMVGACLNCGTDRILMLFRFGDPAVPLDCPVCGCWHKVTPQRIARDDEIPEA